MGPAVDPGPVVDPEAGQARSWLVRSKQRVLDVQDRWVLRRDQRYRHLASTYRLPGGERRIYCHHVRKTAGTSLYLSFLALGGEDPMDVWRRIATDRLHRTVSGGLAFAAHHRRVLAQGDYFFARSHRPAWRQPLPPETFTVTVLRDPLARVHSYFDYLVAGDDPGLPGRVGSAERAIALDGFDAFLEQVPERDLLNQLAMFSRDLVPAEAAERIAACSCVLLTEDFPAGMASLGRRLGLDLRLRHDRAGRGRSELTASQRERLRGRLEPEYELLSLLREAGVLAGRPQSG